QAFSPTRPDASENASAVARYDGASCGARRRFPGADRQGRSGTGSSGLARGREALSPSAELISGPFRILVQYAHCLKEQGNFAAAEIYYRLAIAFGAPLRDVREHLEFTASRQGYHEASEGVAYTAAMVEADTPIDHPAVKANLDFVRSVRRQQNSDDDSDILHTLRIRNTFAEVAPPMIGQ